MSASPRGFDLKEFSPSTAKSITTIQTWIGRGWIFDSEGTLHPTIGPVPDMDEEGQCASFFSGKHPVTGKKVNMRPMAELSNHGTVEEAQAAKPTREEFDRAYASRVHSMNIDLGTEKPLARKAEIKRDYDACLAANGFAPKANEMPVSISNPTPTPRGKKD